MSSELRDQTTVSDWIDHLPVKQEILDGIEHRTEEQKTIDFKWHMELLGDVDHARLCCLQIYITQVLAAIDPNSALYLLEEMRGKIMEQQLYRALGITPN